MRMRTFAAAAAVAAIAASVQANAADLDYDYAPAAEGPAFAPYTFAGWYFGATLGYGDADIDFTVPNGGSNFTADGILGGAIGGYNWQNGRLVYGIDADVLATDVNGGQLGGINSSFADLNWMSSLRGRVGMTIIPQMMIFATLGGAYADANYSVTGPGGSSRDVDLWGWQVGAGAEVALDPNWSLRFDYQYTDFTEETLRFPGGDLKVEPDINTVRGSVSYRF